MSTKINEIYINTGLSNFNILIFTETWLNTNFYDNEIMNDNMFMIYRNDRNVEYKKKGGGVLIAIRKNISVFRLDYFDTINKEFNFIDILGIKIKHKHKIINLITLYIPPGIKISLLEKVLESIAEITVSLGDNIIMVGDLNCPGFNKSNEQFFSDRYTKIIAEFMYTNQLQQYNNIVNANGVMLDLCITNIEVEIERAIEVITKVDPHHPPIQIQILVSYNNLINTLNYYKTNNPKHDNNNSILLIINRIDEFNFNKINKELLMYELSFSDWSSLLQATNTGDICRAFYHCFNSCISRCVSPSPGGHQPVQFPSWYSREAIKNIKNKNRIWKKYKKSKCSALLDKFKLLRKKVKKLIDIDHNSHNKKIEKNITKNPSIFWGYIRSLRGNSNSINSLVINGITLSDPVSIANAFKQSFSDLYSVGIPRVNENPLILDSSLDELNYSFLDYIIQSFKNLPRKKSQGLDRIPCCVFKDYAQYLYYPMLILLRKIYELGLFPESLKISKIIPICKTGKCSTNVNDFRQVSILSPLAKVIESSISAHILEIIKNKIKPWQHGFTKGRSTATNLISFLQYTAPVLEDGCQVDTIYTDFSKAFDTVEFSILIELLIELDLPPVLRLT